MSMPEVGEHVATITECKMAMTGGDVAKEQLALKWKFESGATMWSFNFFSSNKAFEITGKALKAIGWDPDKNGWRLNEINGTDVLVGKQATVVLEDEEYNGKSVRKIRWINDLNGGGPARVMSPEDTSRFVASLQQRAGSAAAPFHDPKPVSDVDVPF